jgi:hypothetical protein
MRLLVVAEGPSELHGALRLLIEAVLQVPIEVEHMAVKSPEVRVHLRPGIGSGLKKRLLAWIRYAERKNFDGLVLVIDEDGKPERLPSLTQRRMKRDSRCVGRWGLPFGPLTPGC